MARAISFDPFLCICKTLKKPQFSPTLKPQISFPNYSLSSSARILARNPNSLRVKSSSTNDEWGPDPEDEEIKGFSSAATAIAEIEEKEAEPKPAPTEIESLKKGLVDSLYGTDRGLKATSETRAEVLEFISQLEAKNPTPAPTEALALLNGKWVLVYTSFSDLFPLLARSLPMVKVDEISQTIDSESFAVQNSVRFVGPLASASVSTNAKFEVRSPKRVQVRQWRT